MSSTVNNTVSNTVKPKIKEAIIVEGRDDVEVVTRAVDALVIPTHGFGIRQETWALIERAYREKGIIILTDPDHSGDEIRKKLAGRFPGAKHAHVPRAAATSAGDIGIENASPEAVIEAINSAHATSSEEAAEVSAEDISRLGLCGESDSAAMREKVAERLGIAYGNAVALRRMINGYGISLEELERAVEWAKER